MEAVKKYSILIGVILFLGTIAAGLIKYGEDKQNIISRTFSSPEEKVKVIQYVIESPTPAEIQRDRILDSINKSNAIRSRKMRDSLMIVERKSRRKTDSINLLNADQMYQIKYELELLRKNRNN